MRGHIKFYQPAKRFGFIVAEDGRDIFFPATALPPAYIPQRNDPVEFDTRPGRKGPDATDIRPQPQGTTRGGTQETERSSIVPTVAELLPSAEES